MNQFQAILGCLVHGRPLFDVEVDDQTRCVVRGNRRRVVVTRSKRQVEIGKLRCSADAVDAVVLRKRGAIELERGRPHWEVALRLQAGEVLEVGFSYDDVDASVAAAALGRGIGCVVQQA
ncbi:hypothetical protein [Roseateles sp.]|uniref:hypothetical protein n=1 Tax=Roseateles sp. TaxID=1971397 RepID=UPI0039E76884